MTDDEILERAEEIKRVRQRVRDLDRGRKYRKARYENDIIFREKEKARARENYYLSKARVNIVARQEEI